MSSFDKESKGEIRSFAFLNSFLLLRKVKDMANRKYKLCIVGFGTVGGGFAEQLANKKETLQQRYGLKFEVIAIADKHLGSIYDAKGIKLPKAIELAKQWELNILEDEYDAPEKGWNSVKTIKKAEADIVVEATWTDLVTGEPGLTHIKTALKQGKHVITSNKGPCAVAYDEVKRLAEKNEAYLRFEGTVLAGTPALSFIRENLAGCEIKRIKGIVNGTTNYILTKMEREEWSFDKALKKAQELGYAEEDPSTDIDGWDAAGKASILSKVVFGGDISPQEVNRTGIRDIDKEDIKETKEEGKRIKLIANVDKEGGKVKASVKPEEISKKQLLAQVMGTTNALLIRTDHLGQVIVSGPGAGKGETGQALLNDLLTIHRYSTKGRDIYA